MADQEFDQQTDQIDRKLRLAVRNGLRHWIRGQWVDSTKKVLATEAPNDLARLMRFAMRIAKHGPAKDARLAILGAGLCILPRLLLLRPWGAHDIYELEQPIIDWAVQEYPGAAAQWNFIQGDYEQTLTGVYDVIVYDVPAPANEPLLRSHLSAGGLLLGT